MFTSILNALQERAIFRPGKAVEEVGGGVAALRRTTTSEDLRRQSEKGTFLVFSYLVILDEYSHLAGTDVHLLSLLKPQVLERIPGQFCLDQFTVSFDRQGNPHRWPQLLDVLDLGPQRRGILLAAGYFYVMGAVKQAGRYSLTQSIDILDALAAALGLSQLFLVVPIAYDVVRYAGAAYLLYLTWKTFRSNGTAFAPAATERHRPIGAMFRQGLLTNLLNPKMALFVLALFPQFVQPEAGSVALQIMVLATVLNLIAWQGGARPYPGTAWRDPLRLLAVLCEPVVRDGNWQLLECVPAWEGNWTWDCFIAYGWHAHDGQRMLVVINYAPNQSQCRIRLPFAELGGRQWQLRDRAGSAIYERDGGELFTQGLYIDLTPWGYYVFEITSSIGG